MALIKSHEKTFFGQVLVYEHAYHKIAQMYVTNESISISVEIYNDESKSGLLENIHFSFTENDNIGSDIIQIGYALIKTLPEYEGAINVFEEGQPLRELATNM